VRPTLSRRSDPMLLDEVTDALGARILMTDILKPLDTYLSESERQTGRSAGHVDRQNPLADLCEHKLRRDSLRHAPEAISARA
jgi:hypothetical protein